MPQSKFTPALRKVAAIHTGRSFIRVSADPSKAVLVVMPEELRI